MAMKKIVFVTTQPLTGSTLVGRILPLAKRLSRTYEVHVFVHEGQVDEGMITEPMTVHITGRDPFVRTSTGKKRLRGGALVFRLLLNSWRTLVALFQTNPDTVIIVKPLPENTLAVYLWKFLNREKRVLLDADDFELTANALQRVWQRWAIHWSERTAAALSQHIVVATPFLQDHFQFLSAQEKPITLMPTGIEKIPPSVTVSWTMSPTLLYIGSISESSGHQVGMLPDMLEIVRRTHEDAKLIMAGTGDTITLLKEAFQKKGQKAAVEWTGRFALSEVPALLQRASIILDPIDASITNRAKSSFRVAAAAAHGIPVVTSDVGIRPFWLPPSLHSRLFATPGDDRAYATKVLELIDQPLTDEERNIMRQHALHYTWDSLVKQYGKLL